MMELSSQALSAVVEFLTVLNGSEHSSRITLDPTCGMLYSYGEPIGYLTTLDGGSYGFRGLNGAQ